MVFAISTLEKSFRARKRERVEDTVCSIVHNVVSRDVTSEIHTRKSLSFLCDTLLGLRRVIHSKNKIIFSLSELTGTILLGWRAMSYWQKPRKSKPRALWERRKRGRLQKREEAFTWGPSIGRRPPAQKNDLGIMTGQGWPGECWPTARAINNLIRTNNVRFYPRENMEWVYAKNENAEICIFRLLCPGKQGKRFHSTWKMVNFALSDVLTRQKYECVSS